MKTTNSIRKSLKILLRSKSSAIVVLLAPLIIVLIIGLGFLDTGETIMNLGVITPSTTDTTERFVRNLDTVENNIIRYEVIEDCVLSIQEGRVLACVYFPPGFEITDEASEEITFYIDESRINLVYRLISSLSLSVEGEQAEIREEITSDILSVLDQTSRDVDRTITETISIRSSINTVLEKIEDASKELGDLDTSSEDFVIDDYSSELDDLEEEYSLLVERAEKVIDESSQFSNESAAFDDAITDLDDVLYDSDDVIENFEVLSDALTLVSESFVDLQAKLSDVESTSSEVQSALDSIEDELDEINTALDSLRTRQDLMVERIDQMQFRDAGRIARPVGTNIEPITSDMTRLTYSFPYLLMLVIMLVGVMLSSTLVFMEKDSKAYFRNFTTPTKNIFFTMVTFLTSALVIFLQVFIIMIVAYFFLNVPVLDNLSVTITLLLLATIVFIMIGMFIGHLFNTSEAITMANIAIGSIFIFLSNLILPIETLSETIQKISSYNPYVIMSESLRSSLLFNSTYQSLLTEILLIIAYSAILFIIILVLLKISSSKYIYDLRHKKNKKKQKGEDFIINKKKITSVESLFEALESISEKEYKELTTPKNVISEWLKEELGRKYLAMRIKKKNKKDALNIIKKRLKKKK